MKLNIVRQIMTFILQKKLLDSRMKGIMTKERKLKKATDIVNAGIGFTSRRFARECV